MSDADRLDGNALGGVLGEIFSPEMTAAIGTCAHCGARGAIGGSLLYTGGPGTVLRCSSCEGVLLRFARTSAGLKLELIGVRLFEVPV